MTYFEQAIIALPVMTLLGVMISVAGIAGIEGVMKKAKLSNLLWGFLAVGLFAGVFGACWWWWFHGPGYFLDEYGNPDVGAAGASGDMFGGLTALFSGLAFAGLITTLFMQRQELKLQRQELELSRGEFKLQRFENTLFGLLELFNGHVQSLETASRNGRGGFESGRSVLKEISQKYLTKQHVHRYEPNPGGRGRLDEWSNEGLDTQVSGYIDIYEKRLEEDLGPYFRLLYNMIRHIEGAKLVFDGDGRLDYVENERQKQIYSKIVRAYLSASEIKLLMFNCATHLGEEFKPWVCKYQLLKHIHLHDVQENPNMVRYFGADAFGARHAQLEEVILAFESSMKQGSA